MIPRLKSPSRHDQGDEMRRWFGRAKARTQAEALWCVITDGNALTITDPLGAAVRVDIADLIGVAVQTTDDGPLATDVWWLLFGAGGRVAGRFPLGASGMEAALDQLGRLPGFDHGAMAVAMGSTRDELFPIWLRPDDRPADEDPVQQTAEAQDGQSSSPTR